MIKNFSARSLGINGRQSELIELALTYAFDGFDIDMQDLYRRSLRTDIGDATKYLTSAAKAYEQKSKPLDWGGFDLGVDMDADEESFTSQVGTLNPLADLAHDIGLSRAYVTLPAATDRLEFSDYLEAQSSRVQQVNEVLKPRSIQLGIGFNAGKELAENKQFEFIRTVEQFISFVNDAGENVGFILNNWDWMIGGGTTEQMQAIPADKIVAAILCGLPDDLDLAAAASTDRVLPIVDGKLNPVSWVKHLASLEFEGPISPGASAKQYKGQTREAIVKAAQEAIDEIFTTAGLEITPLPMDLIEDIPYEASTSIT